MSSGLPPTSTLLPALEARNRIALDRRDAFRRETFDTARDLIAAVDQLKHSHPYMGNVVCPVGDHEYHMFSVNDDVVAWLFFWTGAYEKALMDLWDRLTKDVGQHGGVALDIGAYSGLYAMVAARNGCTTHAFELMLRTAERAKINFRLNGLADRITLHPYGLSDRDGTVQVHMPRVSDFLGTGNSIDEKPNVNTVETVVSTVRAVKTVMEAARIGRIEAVKIDVEGHELELLTALRPWLERDRPEMIVEISRQQDACHALLADMGYAVRQLRGENYHAEPGQK
ncbi:FkbM family methyltransferase [Jannaschia pohangensis]|uniref:Methyltransferase, FkbM family n=1 Tax=Jannaschia pohangensis TaxID=390807 RepID=A0A1I3TI19_9RHOB|nr:FkbM family methyltransferase [Jannaschia pohangensis]SFJ70884.1 methyltransferase, FkbM family [Jannaschia pohangensis]